MFSCLQILDVFLWFVLITLLNFTLIILTLSVSRLLNLLLRLVAFLLFPLHDALPIYPEGLPRLGREDVAAAPAPRAARACRAAASARPLEEGEDILRQRGVEVGSHPDLTAESAELAGCAALLHRSQPGDGLPVARDHDLLSARRPVEQA